MYDVGSRRFVQGGFPGRVKTGALIVAETVLGVHS